MNKQMRKWTLTRRLSITVAVFFVAIATIIVTASYWFYRNSATDNYGEMAASIATSVAGGIDAQALTYAMALDYENDFHAQVQRTLNHVKDARDKIAFIYVIVPYNNEFFRYFADGQRTGEDASFLSDFGDIETDPEVYGEEVWHALRNREIVFTSSYDAGDYGRLISGFAPILDDSGSAVAIVGVDFSVEHVGMTAMRFLGSMLWVTILLVIIFAFIISYMLSASLKKALNRIVKFDPYFTNGVKRFETRETDSGEQKDQIAILYFNFAELVNTFSALFVDMAMIVEEHKKGNYDVRIDENKYRGGHLELVKKMNEMVEMYANDFIEVLGSVKAFGEGDFEKATPHFDEGWVWVAEAIDTLKLKFKNITTEVGEIVQHAAHGDFNYRIDTTKFKGEWSSLTAELNKLMNEVKVPLEEIEDNIRLLSIGDFSMLEMPMEGTFDQVKKAMNISNTNAYDYVEEISEVLSAMAEGDLTKTFHKDYVGAYAPIKSAALKIIEVMNQNMKALTDTAEYIAENAQVLQGNTTSLAEGIGQQASVIDNIINNINTSAGNIEQTGRASTEKANKADTLAKKSNDYAKQGNEEMKTMIHSMDGIKESSDNISKIIKVIEDIAFQTNLLALNASVEAARAGEHGAGFSVVASEVRDLAQRSSLAAKETTALIEDSLDKVESGTEVAQSTAKSLDTIVSSADDVSMLISEIATMTQEQTSTIGGIVNGLKEIATLSESTAAASEESASMAQEFSKQADTLKEMVAFYKLKR